MKKSRILLVIAVVLALVMTMTACDLSELFPETTEPTTGSTVTPDPHECESVCPTCGKCLDAECTEDACSDKCSGHNEPTPDHTCSSVCPECELCLDAECTEDACANKCQGHTVESTPVITVVPAELAINAGDDISLLFGVSVTDELDPEVKVIIQDDDDFDADVQGVYTITYYAVNKFGNSATATRKITVNKALSALSLETQKNLLGESKWQGTIINFKNQEYKALNSSVTLDKQSGVFHNTSSSSITVTVSNSDYAVVAIIDANGVVIEGRDGANNKLVNAANPVRTASTTALKDINKVADDMVIPAGGFAIVVQKEYAGTTVDSDGRGFMNYNVIGTYGNVVRLVWADTNEVLTPYVNQAPVISGYNTTVYAGSAEFVLDTEVLAGVTASDDNGTFDISDDTTVTVTVVNNGGFDISTQGKYTVTLEATDGTLTTTVTRVVEVTTKSVEIKINNNSFTTIEDYVAVNYTGSAIRNYLFFIYTPDYNGGINFTNGYGEAFIINKYGEIVRIYDGASAKYYDADNKSGVQNGTCTAGGYLTEAYNSRQPGEYLLVAPNDGGANTSRGFLYGNRTIGAKVTLPGITFAAHECESKCTKCGGCFNETCTEAACVTKCTCHDCTNVCEICGRCANVACTENVCADKCVSLIDSTTSKYFAINGSTFAAGNKQWLYNTQCGNTTEPKAQNYRMIIFDRNYNGTFATNSYGVAVVVDGNGNLVKGYAWDGYYTESGKADIHYAVGDYATTAFAELKAGEVLIIFPNDGVNGADSARTFGKALCDNWATTMGKKVELSGYTFSVPTHECESVCEYCKKCANANCTENVCASKCTCQAGQLYITIGTHTQVIAAGQWAKNAEITAGTQGKYSLWMFDNSYTGTKPVLGYGSAMLLDAEGKLIRIYDGANGQYWINGAQGTKPSGYSGSDYTTVAWKELAETPGGTLIICAQNAPTDLRAWVRGFRSATYFNQVMSLVEIK